MIVSGIHAELKNIKILKKLRINVKRKYFILTALGLTASVIMMFYNIHKTKKAECSIYLKKAGNINIE